MSDTDHLQARERLSRELGQLDAEIEQAVFLFGALGHGGEHDRCGPCQWVSRNVERCKAAFDEAQR